MADHTQAVDSEVGLETVEPGIAVLTLNRPEVLNALSDASVATLARRLDEVDADRSLRVLVVTGAGRGFCAGFDLAHAESAIAACRLAASALAQAPHFVIQTPNALFAAIVRARIWVRFSSSTGEMQRAAAVFRERKASR